jgi:medium-chain acyl-[acyl-carrier-protein] hydrolase
MKNLSETELSIRTKYRITSADTDMFGRLRLGGLMNFLIQSAIQSADSLGFGFKGLKGQQLFWVLSRITVEINKEMRWYDEIEIETWPKDVEKLLYLRDFIMRDKDGNKIGRATSGWLAIDVANKRPRKVDAINEDVLIRLNTKKAFEELPEKLNGITQGEEKDIKASYFDIDLNRHVTSSRYIDWMMDFLPVEFHEKNYPVKFSINYMKETMPGETIRLVKNQLPNGQVQFEGTNQDRNLPAFRGLISF